MEVDIQPKVVAAVAALAPRMTLGDVMLRGVGAGLDSGLLRQQLVAIAEATGGHIETAPNGDVVYIFPRRPRLTMRFNTTRQRLRHAMGVAYRVVGTTARIAFGVFLFASIFLAVAAILAVVIIALTQRREGGGGGPLLPVHTGGGGGPDGGGGGPGGYRHFSPWLYGNNSWMDMWMLMWMMDHHEMRRRNRRWEDEQDPVAEELKPLRGGGGGGGGAGGGGGGGGGGRHGPEGGDGGSGSGSGGNSPPVPMGVVAEFGGYDSNGPPEPEMSFLEAVFAFVFGRGDINADMEKRRWRAIGLLLRHNKGAVFAEQVAPFLDTWLLPPSESWWAKLMAVVRRLIPSRRGRRDSPVNSSQMHEGYMLAVLRRFGGHAEASDDGRLVYVFPHLQVSATAPDTASSSSREHPVVTSPPPIPPPIYEKMQLTADGGEKQPMVIALGLINVILLLVFRRIGGLKYGEGKSVAEILESDREAGLLLLLLAWVPRFVSWIFKPLLSYAVTFFAIPAVRYLWNSCENTQISSRNAQRRTRAVEAVRLAVVAAADKADQARLRQRFEIIVDETNP